MSISSKMITSAPHKHETQNLRKVETMEVKLDETYVKPHSIWIVARSSKMYCTSTVFGQSNKLVLCTCFVQFLEILVISCLALASCFHRSTKLRSDLFHSAFAFTHWPLWAIHVQVSFLHIRRKPKETSNWLVTKLWKLKLEAWRKIWFHFSAVSK